MFAGRITSFLCLRSSPATPVTESSKSRGKRIGIAAEHVAGPQPGSRHLALRCAPTGRPGPNRAGQRRPCRCACSGQARQDLAQAVAELTKAETDAAIPAQHPNPPSGCVIVFCGTTHPVTSLQMDRLTPHALALSWTAQQPFLLAAAESYRLRGKQQPSSRCAHSGIVINSQAPPRSTLLSLPEETPPPSFCARSMPPPFAWAARLSPAFRGHCGGRIRGRLHRHYQIRGLRQRVFPQQRS